MIRFFTSMVIILMATTASAGEVRIGGVWNEKGQQICGPNIRTTINGALQHCGGTEQQLLIQEGPYGKPRAPEGETTFRLPPPRPADDPITHDYGGSRVVIPADPSEPIRFFENPRFKKTDDKDLRWKGVTTPPYGSLKFDRGD